MQIDVSKEKVFGKNKEAVEQIAKDVFRPYITLLHKAYERDIIFNDYYDMIVDLLSNESEGSL